MNTKRIYAAVFTALICFTACKHGGKDNSQKNGETLIPVLTKLSVAGQNFTDFSKNTFNVARTQEANIESVEVIAEAAAGTDITFTPDLYSGKWKIKSGINSLAITLNNGKTNTYIVSLTKKTAPPSEENPKLLSLTVNGERRVNPVLVSEFNAVSNTVSNVKIKIEPESGAVPTITPALTGSESDTWNLNEGENVLSIKLIKNTKESVYIVKLVRMNNTSPVLELKKLEIGKTKFTDLSSSKLLNADSVTTDKVKVIAEADTGIVISFEPKLDAENNWVLASLGEHTLKIKLTRGSAPPVIYTVNILRKFAQNESMFEYIKNIRYQTAENGISFPVDFNIWKESLLKEENGKRFCIIDSIYPEDYLGFIFILKSGSSKIKEVKQKSMKAGAYTKMYHTKTAIVSQNTAEPYFVYYFAKYSFSKMYAETADILISYEDGKEDEFTVKAKNGVVTD